MKLCLRISHWQGSPHSLTVMPPQVLSGGRKGDHCIKISKVREAFSGYLQYHLPLEASKQTALYSGLWRPQSLTSLTTKSWSNRYPECFDAAQLVASPCCTGTLGNPWALWGGCLHCAFALGIDQKLVHSFYRFLSV